MTVPVLSPVARPLVPDAFETLATDESDELQVAAAVTSWVRVVRVGPGRHELLLACPSRSHGLTGVTVIEVSTAAVTVRSVAR